MVAMMFDTRLRITETSTLGGRVRVARLAFSKDPFLSFAIFTFTKGMAARTFVVPPPVEFVVVECVCYRMVLYYSGYNTIRQYQETLFCLALLPPRPIVVATRR